MLGSGQDAYHLSHLSSLSSSRGSELASPSDEEMGPSDPIALTAPSFSADLRTGKSFVSSSSLAAGG